MVCGFGKITQVALIYVFGGVSFFNWTWLLFCLVFFSHIVKKKKVLKKSYVIKLYKVHGPIHMFGWLT